MRLTLAALVAAGLGLKCLANSSSLQTYPDYDDRIRRDSRYQVSVEQNGTRRSLTVYDRTEQSALAGRTRGGDTHRRFCAFAFSGAPVEVRIRVSEDVASYAVFPARRRLRHGFRDGVVSVFLEEPAYFGLRLNDSDASILSVFADAPETDVPQKGDPGVLFVDKWLDAPQPRGILWVGGRTKEVYVAPGAVLNARLHIDSPGVKVHGRGLLLDPLSDPFRYQERAGRMMGAWMASNHDLVLDGLTCLDARAYNVMTIGTNIVIRNWKELATMMCTDGITVCGRGLSVSNAWLYVGDNGIVHGGPKSEFRDVAIGTSCAALFPQGSGDELVVFDGLDVFRADDGFINNQYNPGKKGQRPSERPSHGFSWLLRNVSAVDCVYLPHLLRGRDMGKRTKEFSFEGAAFPAFSGEGGWRTAARTDGPAVWVLNEPARDLPTDNYRLSFRDVTIGGRSVRDQGDVGLSLAAATNVSVGVLPASGRETTLRPVADRCVVNWRSPVRPPAPGRVCDGLNLLSERWRGQSVWQRNPSWLSSFEIRTGQDGVREYCLFGLSWGAGLETVFTELFRERGNGRWRLTFEVKKPSEISGVCLRTSLFSNEKTLERWAKVTESGWQRLSYVFDADFDWGVTELVALHIQVRENACSELAFRNFVLVKE